MKLTRSSVILGVIGVLLLAAAAVVRFAVLPSVSKLPTDLDTTQKYSGTYSGVNLAALTQTGSGAGPAVLANVPATASRQYQASSTHGNTEIVTRTLERSVGGRASPTSKVQYAVDRGTFESTTPPSGVSGVTTSQGLIFTLPLHPSTTASYRLWDENTAAAYPLTYKGTATVADRDTYRFESAAKGTVPSPAALGLPTSISRPQLIALGPQLLSLLPPALQSQVPALLAALPNSIPLAWTATDDTTLYADQTTGAPIRVQSTQQFSAGISLLGQTLAVPLGTLTLKTTSASEASTASDASSNASSLTLVGTTLPLILLILGVVVLVIAVVLAIRAGRRPGGTAAVPQTPERTPTPA